MFYEMSYVLILIHRKLICPKKRCIIIYCTLSVYMIWKERKWWVEKSAHIIVGSQRICFRKKALVGEIKASLQLIRKLMWKGWRWQHKYLCDRGDRAHISRRQMAADVSVIDAQRETRLLCEGMEMSNVMLGKCQIWCFSIFTRCVCHSLNYDVFIIFKVHTRVKIFVIVSKAD